MTARDLAAFLADLAAFNDGQRRARAAYARRMADLEPAPKVKRKPPVRHCKCGAVLKPHRNYCDPCRDKARAEVNDRAQRRYRARKAER